MGGYNISNLNFLVVEDNPHMQRIVRTLFAALGVKEVRTVADGESALKELAAQPADIVICDWIMEPMSGIELVRRLRDEKTSPSPFVPIIMLTGHSEQHRVAEARDAGANEFLAKPVSAQALYDHIASIIGRPRPFVRAEGYFGPDRRRHDEDYRGVERRGAADDAASPDRGERDGTEAAETEAAS